MKTLISFDFSLNKKKIFFSPCIFGRQDKNLGFSRVLFALLIFQFLYLERYHNLQPNKIGFYIIFLEWSHIGVCIFICKNFTEFLMINIFSLKLFIISIYWEKTSVINFMRISCNRDIEIFTYKYIADKF